MLIPKTLNSMLSSFIRFFDSESHFLRNTVMDIIGAMIQKVLSEGVDEDSRHSREKYLERLLGRVYDKNALCRAHLLGLLDDLCTANLVLPELLPELLRVATDRAKDTSSKVRKRALELLLSVLRVYLLLHCEGSSKFRPKAQALVERQATLTEAETLKQQLHTVEEAMARTEDEEAFEEMEREAGRLRHRLKEQGTGLDRLELYLDMLVAIEDLVGTLCNLLGSRVESDILQALQVLEFLSMRGLKEAERGLKKGLMLIFSLDKKVKQMVISCFHGILVRDQ